MTPVFEEAPAAERGTVIDLAAALEASLAEARAGQGAPSVGQGRDRSQRPRRRQAGKRRARRRRPSPSWRTPTSRPVAEGRAEARAPASRPEPPVAQVSRHDLLGCACRHGCRGTPAPGCRRRRSTRGSRPGPPAPGGPSAAAAVRGAWGTVANGQTSEAAGAAAPSSRQRPVVEPGADRADELQGPGLVVHADEQRAERRCAGALAEPCSRRPPSPARSGTSP